MKIFITGVAGFLGSHLADAFIKKGYVVHGCDNMVGGNYENINHLEGNPLFRFWPADCCDLPRMQKIIHADVVYHCAATAHEGLSVFSPSYITRNIFEASVSVFSACAQNKVGRVIFLSSMARYGEGEPPFSEDKAPKPVDPYGIAKFAAEEVLKVLAKVNGFNYSIAVPHNIIGVRQNYQDPYRNVVSIMLNRIKSGKEPIVYGDGTQVRCFSPIEDIIECLVKMADGCVDGEVVNIGPDKGEISINGLVDTIAKNLGIKLSPAYVPGRPQEVKNAFCTAEKARERLGYNPRGKIGECIKKMYQAIPEGGARFYYNYPLEIVNDKTPKTWKDRMI
jgi:UDP-glucose 4-epimerase